MSKEVFHEFDITHFQFHDRLQFSYLFISFLIDWLNYLTVRLLSEPQKHSFKVVWFLCSFDIFFNVNIMYLLFKSKIIKTLNEMCL